MDIWCRCRSDRRAPPLVFPPGSRCYRSVMLRKRRVHFGKPVTANVFRPLIRSCQFPEVTSDTWLIRWPLAAYWREPPGRASMEEDMSSIQKTGHAMLGKVQCPIVVGDINSRVMAPMEANFQWSRVGVWGQWHDSVTRIWRCVASNDQSIMLDR